MLRNLSDASKIDDDKILLDTFSAVVCSDLVKPFGTVDKRPSCDSMELCQLPFQAYEHIFFANPES
jgi:hypothetical protein